MTKGGAIVYQGVQGILVDFHLAQLGGVDEQGKGVLTPAMVGEIHLVDDRVLTDIPLSQLQEAEAFNGG